MGTTLELTNQHLLTIVNRNRGNIRERFYISKHKHKQQAVNDYVYIALVLDCLECIILDHQVGLNKFFCHRCK